MTAERGVVAAHTAHLLVIGVPTITMTLIAIVADLRSRVARRRQARAMVNSRSLAAAAAACSVLATAIHITVAPAHFHEDVLFGVFFTVTATCQLGWAVVVLTRPTRLWLVAGCVGNAAVVSLWFYTRFVGLPLGPEAGAREEIGARDLMATGVELLLVLTTAWLLARSRQVNSDVQSDQAVTPELREVELVG
jgi:hypothetical protein